MARRGIDSNGQAVERERHATATGGDAKRQLADRPRSTSRPLRRFHQETRRRTTRHLTSVRCLLRRAPRSAQILIERQGRRAHPVSREHVQHSLARGCAERLSKIGVGHQALERAAQRSNIAGRNHEASLAVHVHPRHSGRHVGADDRPATQHGFQLHHPKGFLASGGRKHQRGARVQPGQALLIGHVTRQVYAIADVQLAHHRLQSATERSVADDHQSARPAPATRGAARRVPCTAPIARQTAESGRRRVRAARQLSRRPRPWADIDRRPARRG